MVSSYFQLAFKVHHARSSALQATDPVPEANLGETFFWSGSSGN
jgi:hypothetical protein